MRRKAQAVALTALLVLGTLALAQQAKKGAPEKNAGKHYVLAATPETVQWGWLDNKEPPKLTLNSGDTVSIETITHAMGELQPGKSMDEIVKLRLANPGGGPHTVTGPIYVNDAEPGDTLELRILKIVPKPDAFNFHLPGSKFPTVGLLAADFPEGYVRFFSVDWQKKQVEFKPGIVLPLRPFPGTLAIGPDPNEPKEKAGPPIHDAKGRTSTLRPWKNGSNMDVNELQQGSTVYLPVFQKGALIWTGDSHCLQGNGEVNLSALECSYKEIELQPIVHKGVKTEWPWAETATDYIFMGFDEDLNEAMKIAVRNTVEWLSRQKIVPMSRDEGYMLASMAADCRVTQVVDIRKGVHCMIPKSIFTQGTRTQEAIGLTSDKPGAR